ncbi:MAG: hypothetical protein KGI60_02380 [Patescibacteria group bacterium]|nr:hypothetical protein [Patescibacteria group bacterium]
MEDRFMEKYDRTEDRFTRRVLAHRFADSLMGYAHNLAEQILSKNKTA